MERSKNIETVLRILQDEINGDVAAALEKMTADYSMTWVYKNRAGELFPKTKKLNDEMQEAYVIKDRHYDIKHITEHEDTVMVELVESYPDPKTGEVYRTPLVLVLEMEDGKIKKGRHYCDPQLSHLHLSEEEINKAFE